jgi:Holliday junction DNA helicase RuvA
MTKFALMIASSVPVGQEASSDLMSEAYEALISVGHNPQDARTRIETVMESKKKFKSVEEILAEIYQRQRK